MPTRAVADRPQGRGHSAASRCARSQAGSAGLRRSSSRLVCGHRSIDTSGRHSNPLWRSYRESQAKRPDGIEQMASGLPTVRLLDH